VEQTGTDESRRLEKRHRVRLATFVYVGEFEYYTWRSATAFETYLRLFERALKLRVLRNKAN
jgi:hypothetical protein